MPATEGDGLKTNAGPPQVVLPLEGLARSNSFGGAL
ncbi:hypothetical protein BCh11DRAFT_04068 [Burkholderia sp. Ch1-1]|nr:hypothetical protein BCh11DRAFT_04068 [Burkholderia sp. Ch1-1]